MRSVLSIGILAACVAASPMVSAQVNNESLVCRVDDPLMDKYSYLRSLSFDLTGVPPTMEQFAALDDVDEVPEAMIDEMLASEAFVQRAVRHHRSLLWNNVTNVTLHNYRTSMRRTGDRFWRTRPAYTYRGFNVPCYDTPATFGPNGEIEYVLDADGYKREGYVMVTPYWDPATSIKVCAFDAQTAAVSPSGIDCKTNAGFNDPMCGCGDNLQLCRYLNYSAVQSAMGTDVDMRIASVIRNNEPYTNIFTSRRGFASGEIVHFLKHQTRVPAGVRSTPVSIDYDYLPDLEWARDYSNFVEYTLPSDHAGILTSPAFLLRFQTNRARANRFFEAFLCQPFSPPVGGLPATDPNKLPDPDLQRRDGCKYCHALLEPAASHWGRWTERGWGFLNPVDFPAEREDCRICGTSGQLCSTECRLYYTTRTFSSEEAAYIGKLNAFQFLREDHMRNVDYGPKLLVASSVVDRRFPTCTARRALEGMFGRQIDEDEQPWLEDLSMDFLASDYSYKALIKSIVTSKIYRRVR